MPYLPSPFIRDLLAGLTGLAVVALLVGSSVAAAGVGAVGMANPASVACVKRGGRLEIRTLSDGGQVGYCHLAGGRVCEEWALFRDHRCVRPPKGPKPTMPPK